MLIRYFVKSELADLKQIEPRLLEFFHDAGLPIYTIDYEKDEDRQELELFKQKQFDEIQQRRKAFDAEAHQIKLVAADNVIPKAAVDINDLQVEMRNVVLQGEIFKIDIRDLKDNKRLYLYSISDYTSAITIKAFESVKQPGAPKHWSDRNLPNFYLRHFKVGM
ncbi:DNA polymerase III polC-type [Bacteroidales bacterium Barb6]|nr:DNA polymerase III polC-type [Bacteroidales bacterium Barb6]